MTTELDLGLVSLAFVWPTLPVSAYVFHRRKYQERTELIALNVSNFSTYDELVTLMGTHYPDRQCHTLIT